MNMPLIVIGTACGLPALRAANGERASNMHARGVFRASGMFSIIVGPAQKGDYTRPSQAASWIVVHMV